MTEITKPLPGATIDYGLPITRGLVGLWLFNEGAGSRVADTGKGNHGAITNVDLTSAWSGSPQGGGLILDGIDDFIDLPTFQDSITTLTIEVRVALWPTFPGGGAACSCCDGGWGGWIY